MKNRRRNASLQGMATGRALLLVSAVSLATSGFVLSANAKERKTTLITFDAPGAGKGAFQGTQAIAISPGGTITGNYTDSGSVLHGFVRTRDGTFITFDVPGAGATAPWGINPAGTTAGVWFDTMGFAHGFVRARDGAITKFDVRGATQTWAYNINSAGTVAGYYDKGEVFHGFVRDPSGAITTFDAPGAGTGFLQGTQTSVTTGLNPAGAVTGDYLDASFVYHGFVRAPNGAITTFDVPGAGKGGFQGVFPPGGINPKGAITGGYVDANNVNHGFVRAPDGAITTFDVPGAGAGPFQGTLPGAISPAGIAISPAGTVTGVYFDAGNAPHGFVRDPHGAVTTIDAPGAGTGLGQGTNLFDSNPAGAIVGYYIDSSNVFHGFLVEGE